MSIVLEYHPEKATKAELVEFLKNENFQRCDYFLKPFPKGSTYLSWFDDMEYKSIDGLEAVIYPKEKNINKSWAVFTRTRVWASAFDKQKQNDVIRKARKAFGGYFLNDSQGRNRYIKIAESEFLKPSESGIFQVYEKIKSQMSKLNTAIADHQESLTLDINKDTHKDIINLFKENRPSIALYNSLVPFLVSAIEHYFRELFVVLIEFDAYGKDEISKMKLKDIAKFNTINDIRSISKGETKLEREIARGFNFQNLDKINEIYRRLPVVRFESVIVYGS